VLQRIVLQCIVLQCIVLQCISSCCSATQVTLVRFTSLVLQCVAAVLRYTCTYGVAVYFWQCILTTLEQQVLQYVLQYVAVCCSV